MNDYIKSLEESNEDYHRKIIVLEDVINSYKKVEFVFVPKYDDRDDLISLSIKLSFKGVPDSLNICYISRSKMFKNSWHIHDNKNQVTDIVDIKYSNDVYDYINFMLTYLDIPHIKNIIVI